MFLETRIEPARLVKEGFFRLWRDPTAASSSKVIHRNTTASGLEGKENRYLIVAPRVLFWI